MDNKADKELVQPIVNGKLFDNPWPTWRKASVTELFRWMVFGKNNTNLPSDPKVNIQKNYSLKKNALMFMKQPKRLFQTIKYKSVLIIISDFRRKFARSYDNR
jgi:hypothetical protein